MIKEEISRRIREGYAQVAKKQRPCCPSSDCARDISTELGYTDQELKSAPEDANMALGSGNPVALASIRAGETVLDLGSGPGLDCFLAAERVGKRGRVIGVDMTPEMIEKARENSRNGDYENVEFRLGDIEELPVDDNSVDLVISNCVINLVPEKIKTFREAFRVLKPGGRMTISDIVLLKELPDVIKNSIEAYIACVSGAMIKDEYIGAIKAAGFQQVRIIDERASPIGLLVNDPLAKAVIEEAKITAEEVKEVAGSVISITVSGVKPALGKNLLWG
jgi:ubiquinone/menaquinone biosynthesis C-methylase UbiE